MARRTFSREFKVEAVKLVTDRGVATGLKNLSREPFEKAISAGMVMPR
jgi:transposase-like protein